MIFKNCIYCNKDKAENEFSLEHIWPDKLGGKLAPDLFKTRNVCKKCNNNFGIYVDGAFLKDWFTNKELSSYNEPFINPSNPKPLPLIYWGELKDFPCENNEVAELWTGSVGDQVIHVHKKDTNNYDTYIGGDPLKRKEDKGEIFFAIASKNPFWVKLCVKSIVTFFPDAERYCVTECMFENKPFKSSNWKNPDLTNEIVSKKINYFFENKQPNVQKAMKINAEQRFLAKLAIGLCHNFFGDNYLKTESYTEYLYALNHSEIPDELSHYLFRVPPYDNNDILPNIGFINNAWNIIFFYGIEALYLILCYPSGRKAVIRLVYSCELNFDKLFKQNDAGMFGYIVQPYADYFSERLSFIHVVNFNSGVVTHDTLQELKDKTYPEGILPPRENGLSTSKTK